jgi:hypothetical protein
MPQEKNLDIFSALISLYSKSVVFWKRWGINMKPNSIQKWIREELKETQVEIDFIGTPEFDALRTAQEISDVVVVVLARMYALRGEDATRLYIFDVAKAFCKTLEEQPLESLKTAKMPSTAFDETERECKQALALALNLFSYLPRDVIEVAIRNTIEKNDSKNITTHHLVETFDQELGELVQKVTRRVAKKDPDGDTITDEAENEITQPLTLMEKLSGKKKPK